MSSTSSIGDSGTGSVQTDPQSDTKSDSEPEVKIKSRESQQTDAPLNLVRIFTPVIICMAIVVAAVNFFEYYSIQGKPIF